MNCYQHNSQTTHICNKLDCKYKLACNSCVNQQHIGHIDINKLIQSCSTNITPLSKFVDRMLYEFQRSEVDRLKRIYFKEDIIYTQSNRFPLLIFQHQMWKSSVAYQKRVSIFKRKNQSNSQLKRIKVNLPY